VVAGRLINGYSVNDWTLGLLYRVHSSSSIWLQAAGMYKVRPARACVRVGVVCVRACVWVGGGWPTGGSRLCVRAGVLARCVHRCGVD
jgi:hypothetical protein